MSTGEVESIPVRSIRPGVAVRDRRLDLDHVALLRPVLDQVPPVEVRKTGDHFELVDGHHRHAAAKVEGREEIRAVVVVLDDAAAYLRAVTANGSHGMGLTLSERKAAARRLVAETSMSDRAIATACSLDHKTVAALRPTGESPQLDGKTAGQDGKRRPATAADRKALRAAIADLIAQHPDLSSTAIAAKAGASTMTVVSVRKEIETSTAGDDDSPAVDEAPPASNPPAAGGATPPHLSLAPPVADPSPSVGDVVTSWPVVGQWAKETGFDGSNDARALAELLDRRFLRPGEVDLLERLARSCPAPSRMAVTSAIRSQVVHWLALVHEIENTPNMEAAK